MIVVAFDGGVRGHHGPAAGGAVISFEKRVITVARFIPRATSIQAEYEGAILGLEVALELGLSHLILQGDAEIVINQLRGSYACRAKSLQLLLCHTKRLINQLGDVQLRWVPRSCNKEADRAVNCCLNQKSDFRLSI